MDNGWMIQKRQTGGRQREGGGGGKEGRKDVNRSVLAPDKAPLNTVRNSRTCK